jgi:hypothetical protein
VELEEKEAALFELVDCNYIYQSLLRAANHITNIINDPIGDKPGLEKRDKLAKRWNRS